MLHLCYFWVCDGLNISIEGHEGITACILWPTDFTFLHTINILFVLGFFRQWWSSSWLQASGIGLTSNDETLCYCTWR